MVHAARHSGTADRRSVFELFPRRLPEGRRYGVVAGVGRALDAIEGFVFDDAALATLDEVVDDDLLHWLSTFRFSGDVWGYAEGEAYFPYSPLLVVEGTFAEAVLLETLMLSIYNHDSAIASAASRMTLAAGTRPCIEMGSRRTHEQAAVAAARAAYVAGFATTSNLAAGQRYGVPTAGTAAHSFTLLHDTEADAFRAQVDSLGAGTTLLVDTYDVTEAVRLAVEVAGPELGAVRLDSGDLGEVARVDAHGAQLVAGHLDAEPHRLGDVVGVDEQCGAPAERVDLRAERVRLGVVQKRERVGRRARGGDAVALPGGEVGRRGEAGDVRRAGRRDCGFLVGTSRPHLDAGPAVGHERHPGRGRRDRRVVVVDRQQHRLQQHGLGERRLDHEQG